MQVSIYGDEILQKLNNIYGISEIKDTILNYSKYIKLLQENKINGLGNANILIRCPDNFSNDTNKLIDLLYHILKTNNITVEDYYYIVRRELKSDSAFNMIKNKLIIIDTLKMHCAMSFVIEDIRKLLEISKNKIFIIVASDNDKFPNEYLSDVCKWIMKVGVPSTDEKKQYIENILLQNKLNVAGNCNYINDLAQKDMPFIETDLLKVIVNCKINEVSTITNECINTEVQSDVELVESNKSNNKTALECLENMIGLEPVKKQIKQILNYIKINKARGQPPLLHFAFIGPSGVGKTEVSKILGRIFAEQHILSNNIFIQGTRTDLVASYIRTNRSKNKRIFKQSSRRNCVTR